MAAPKKRASGSSRRPRAMVAAEVSQVSSLSDPRLYFNLELSELDFNWRVLHQAQDEGIPLLERVKFLSIAASNIDEFFQKRVGGLKRQEAAGVRDPSPDGLMPSQQLRLIRSASRELSDHMCSLWKNDLRPALRDEAGIDVCSLEDLHASARDELSSYFDSVLFPILTPLAVDPGRPFPLISNLSLSLAVTLQGEAGEGVRFARVKVPVGQPRWLPTGDGRFVAIEEVIAHHVQQLFPGMRVLGAYAFRVTRNAYLPHNEEEADDLVEMISEALRARRFSPVVRLEVEAGTPATVREYLLTHLGASESDLFETSGPMRLADCRQLADLPVPEHRYPSWRPRIPERLQGTEAGSSVFTAIADGDVLVHHPYEQFDATVLRLVEEAADDPAVVAIKQTIYRTAEDSRTVAALVRAAERGKHVTVLVEIKARFEEQKNIEWGQMLEDAGVHVAYGISGLKTHAKVMLILRAEGSEIKSYCHIGTGNYHERTAQTYADLGLLTSRADVGDDLVKFFHYLTGYAPGQRYRKLLVAPRYLRKAFRDMIRDEIGRHEEHGDGRVIAKMNGLDDVETIQELYRASQAGVRCDLIVRGVCRLRPGVPGVSENIRVISIVGRFLEHDRIFYFHHGGNPRILIGSADWRHRNLSDRVEALVPIEEPTLKQRLSAMLEAALADNTSAWELFVDGSYVLRRPTNGERRRNFQERLASNEAPDEAG